ncbi:MAG: hypothetical protein U0L11_06965 [Acutalibacteraceae bacterium]|nr:hypothetical protein [Acutalibacteraceae bacterium]
MKYLYRSVNALLATAVFPIVVFLDFIIIRVGDSLGNLLGAFTGGSESSSILPVGLEQGISIKFVIDIFRGVGEGEFWHRMLVNDEASGKINFVWPESLNAIKGDLIAVVVCLAIVLIAALFIIAWSFISNKRIPVLAAAGTGIVSLIVLRIFFESASEFLRNSFSITDILDGGSLISTLAGSIIDLEDVAIGSFWIVLLFLFIGLLIWTGAYYLIEIGDTPEEKAAAQAKRVKKSR